MDSFKVTFEAAEEITVEEYEQRKETLPAEEMLRAAKMLINQN